MRICCKNSKTCILYRTVKLKGEGKMTEENQDVKTFTQADIDKLNEEHANALKELETRLKGEQDRKVDAAIKKTKAEIEEAAKKAGMSEAEKLNAELEEYKAKYQEQADINALASQKDETRKIMSEMGVDLSCLDFCFVPKDLDATKAKVKAFKEYTDGVKKATFENGIQSKVPEKGKADTEVSGLRQAFGLK